MKGIIFILLVVLLFSGCTLNNQEIEDECNKISEDECNFYECISDKSVSKNVKDYYLEKAKICYLKEKDANAKVRVNVDTGLSF